ncbi:MAG: hypothetical protein IPM63_00315 [Acidobacteriota bacterium]|nr:MAG: hypothetical protein IPM63_00315 [Acidobacteriota bacterium]
MKASTLTLLFIASFLVAANSCATYLNDAKRAQGDDLIVKIEEFRANNGRLPEDLAELGIEERLEGPVFYEKIGSDSYEVWYGTSLGESMIYDSKDREWRSYSRRNE